MSLNERIKPETSVVGLRELTEEDIEAISEAIHKIIKTILLKRVHPKKVDNYDIVIDIINNEGDLQIDIDIISQSNIRYDKKDQKTIDLTLEETFSELEKLLKEKYSG
jgi:hypothetical protein